LATASIRLTRLTGTDHSEIKPVSGPDIAVDRRTNVKRYDDLQRRLAHE
jgi:hypothetical protein